MKYPLIIGLLLFASCKPELVRKNFTTYRKFNGNSYGLRLDGVYYTDPTFVSTEDTIEWIYCVMLFRDGTAAGFTNVSRTKGQPIDSAISSFLNIIKKKRNFGLWGGFNIDNSNRITLQDWSYYEHGYFIVARYNVFEYGGYLVDDSSFIISNSGFVSNERYKENMYFHLYPLKQKPDSTNWLQSDKRLNQQYNHKVSQ